MKKYFTILLLAVVSLSATAQFEKGTHYTEASVSGFGIGVKDKKFNIGIGASQGYFVADGWMLLGRMGYQYNGVHSALIQGGFRYSFQKFGLNLGAGVQYEHRGSHSGNSESSKQDYIQFCHQVGYTFYLNRWISLEPALYCDLALNDVKYGTNAGLKIGIGLYYGKKDIKKVFE